MARLQLILIAAIACWSQTSIPVQQVRGITSASGQVFVTLPNGSVNQALLDAAFTIDVSGPRPVLRVSLPAGVRVARVKVVAGVDAPQSYQLAAPGVTAVNALVFRNGLLQSEGDDYAFTAGVAAGTVTFNSSSATTVQSGDIIQIVAIL